DGRELDALRPHLFADAGERARGDARKFGRIDLPAAIGRGMRPVLNLRPEAVDLPAVEPEQQCASRRTPHVQRENAIHLSFVACRRSAAKKSERTRTQGAGSAGGLCRRFVCRQNRSVTAWPQMQPNGYLLSGKRRPGL